MSDKEKVQHEPEQVPEDKNKGRKADAADAPPETCAPPDIIIEE